MFLYVYIYDSYVTHWTTTAIRNSTEIQMFLLWISVEMTVLPETSHSQQKGVTGKLTEPEKRKSQNKQTNKNVTKRKYCLNPRHRENTIKEANLSVMLYYIWQHNKKLDFLNFISYSLNHNRVLYILTINIYGYTYKYICVYIHTKIYIHIYL